MNWMGGSRSRVKNTKDTQENRQRQFFAQQRAINTQNQTFQQHQHSQQIPSYSQQFHSSHDIDNNENQNPMQSISNQQQKIPQHDENHSKSSLEQSSALPIVSPPHIHDTNSSDAQPHNLSQNQHSILQQSQSQSSSHQDLTNNLINIISDSLNEVLKASDGDNNTIEIDIENNPTSVESKINNQLNSSVTTPKSSTTSPHSNTPLLHPTASTLQSISPNTVNNNNTKPLIEIHAQVKTVQIIDIDLTVNNDGEDNTKDSKQSQNNITITSHTNSPTLSTQQHQQHELMLSQPYSTQLNLISQTQSQHNHNQSQPLNPDFLISPLSQPSRFDSTIDLTSDSQLPQFISEKEQDLTNITNANTNSTLIEPILIPSTSSISTPSSSTTTTHISTTSTNTTNPSTTDIHSIGSTNLHIDQPKSKSTMPLTTNIDSNSNQSLSIQNNSNPTKSNQPTIFHQPPIVHKSPFWQQKSLQQPNPVAQQQSNNNQHLKLNQHASNPTQHAQSSMFHNPLLQPPLPFTRRPSTTPLIIPTSHSNRHTSFQNPTTIRPRQSSKRKRVPLDIQRLSLASKLCQDIEEAATIESNLLQPNPTEQINNNISDQSRFQSHTNQYLTLQEKRQRFLSRNPLAYGNQFIRTNHSIYPSTQHHQQQQQSDSYSSSSNNNNNSMSDISNSSNFDNNNNITSNLFHNNIQSNPDYQQHQTIIPQNTIMNTQHHPNLPPFTEYQLQHSQLQHKQEISPFTQSSQSTNHNQQHLQTQNIIPSFHPQTQFENTNTLLKTDLDLHHDDYTLSKQQNQMMSPFVPSSTLHNQLLPQYQTTPFTTNILQNQSLQFQHANNNNARQYPDQDTDLPQQPQQLQQFPQNQQTQQQLPQFNPYPQQQYQHQQFEPPLWQQYQPIPIQHWAPVQYQPQQPQQQQQQQRNEQFISQLPVFINHNQQLNGSFYSANQPHQQQPFSNYGLLNNHYNHQQYQFNNTNTNTSQFTANPNQLHDNDCNNTIQLNSSSVSDHFDNNQNRNPNFTQQ